MISLAKQLYLNLRYKNRIVTMKVREWPSNKVVSYGCGKIVSVDLLGTATVKSCDGTVWVCTKNLHKTSLGHFRHERYKITKG